MVNKPLEQIEGTVERKLFSGEGFAVLKIRASDGQEVKAVGPLEDVQEGERVVLRGRWRRGAYGREFAVEEVTYSEISGLEKFIASSPVKGIGKAIARRIVEEFGEEAQRVILEEPEKLTRVRGISLSKAEALHQFFVNTGREREALIFFSRMGISRRVAKRILEKYGEEAVQVLKENPYRLALEFRGIGFRKADEIARRLGLDKNSPQRAAAAAHYFLEREASYGNTYMELEEILKILSSLGIERETAREGLRNPAFFIMDDKISLKKYFLWEAEIARRLLERKEASFLPLEDLSGAFRQVAGSFEIQLDQEQKRAVEAALSSHLLIISGGPGTGKTTIIKFIGTMAKAAGLKIKFAAPTGRAARRMTEATGFPASTIHRLLEFDPETGTFKRDQLRPLNVDFLVLDEVSMVDAWLFRAVLRALPMSCRLILVGDKDQLPSVGPGNVLADIISSGLFPLVVLKKIYRQEEGSLIAENARRIRNGLLPYVKRGGEFEFFPDSKPLQRLLSLATGEIPHRLSLPPLTPEIQVISPMYKGPLGVDNLNRLLQEKLNPSGKPMKVGPRKFRSGDKVMQTVNNYYKEVFNGEIGRVIEGGEGELWVDFYGEKVLYTEDDVEELTLAYAISVHKSQGSEYSAVVMPLVKAHWVMLQRNLLYTAITRARKYVGLVGDFDALKRAVSNDQPLRRRTWLALLLKDLSSQGRE